MAQRFRHAWSGIGYSAEREEKRPDFLQWIREQCTLRSGAVLLVSFLVSQAELPGGSLPCSVPFVAALLLLERPALGAVLGCALGLLARWEPIGLVNGWPLLACLLLVLTVRGGWNWKPWKVSLAAAACMALPLPLTVQSPPALMAFLSGTVAAGVLTPVFTRALLALRLRDQASTADDRLCLLLFVATLTMGANWLRVRGSSLGNAVAALCVFAAAWSAGPGLGTPAGVLLGLAQALCGAGAWSIVYFAVLGTLAGLLREGARWLDACGSVAGCSALVFLQGGVLAAAEYLPPIALAGLAFSVMPEGWLDTVKGFLQPRAVLVSDGAGVASLYLLRERARALEEIARLLPDDGEETSIPRLELLACRLCTGCERQQACWDARHEEAMRLLDTTLAACTDLAAEKAQEVAARSAEAFGCLRGAELYPLARALTDSSEQDAREQMQRREARQMLAGQLDAQANALFGLCRQIEESGATALRARSAICGAMPALRGRPDALTVCVLDGRLHVWLAVRCESENRLRKLEETLSTAVGVEMELLRRGGQDWLLFSEKPALRLTVGRCNVPAAGEQISGDGVLQERLDAGHYLLALSDGMGSGREAHRESRAALELMLQALRAGFDRKEALGTVNGMLMACQGGEMYATMDLCVADLDSGEISFEKLGACPSYLLRAGRCRRLGGDALPLGIVGAATPRRMSARLQPGDMLLLVSDGVVDAFGRDDTAFLRALGGLAPQDGDISAQWLADMLLKRALDRCQGVAPDDMTVLAAKVECA